MSGMELSLGEFGDIRRARVGRDFLAALVGGQTTCLRKLGGSRAGEVRFGRFLRNSEVTMSAMLTETGRATGERIGGRHILAIQDTTELNFSAHRGRKQGFGTVGNGVDIGLFLHPVVAVDAVTGGIVGLAGATVLNRTERRRKPRRKRVLSDKESRRWLDGAETAGRVLCGALSITVVADRESDIYEEFARRPANVELLTRAAQDRALEGGGRLFAACTAMATRERFVIDMPAKGNRPARQATVALGFGEVTIKRPCNGAARTLPETLRLRVVVVRETAPPDGAVPVRWVLLTTHRVASVAQARRILAWYRLRWIIEQVFRTLKGQGFAIEDSQVVDAATLAKLATAALIEALVVRLEGQTEKQKNPHPPGSLARAAWVIGRLGGWSGYSGGGYKPPGPKTMYDGLVKFDAIKQGWGLAPATGAAKNV